MTEARHDEATPQDAEDHTNTSTHNQDQILPTNTGKHRTNRKPHRFVVVLRNNCKL